MDLLTIIFLILCLIIGYFIGQKIGILKSDKHWESQLPGHRKDAIMKSRAVLSGFFSEQLSPYLPDFPFNPNEVRFIGKPVDFLVFKGMDEKKIDEVVFVEVKSGNSNLNKIQKSLKDAIENKKVRWEEYRVPDNLTKGRGMDFEDNI